MSVRYCQKSYFNNNSGLIFNNSNISVTRFNKGGGLFEVHANFQRPVIPFCGVVLDASGALKPDTIAHHKTNQDTFLKMWLQFLEASNNAYNDVTGGTSAEYTGINPNPGGTDFSQYLRTFIGQPQNESSALWSDYVAVSYQVWNFWNMADAAWTDAQLNAALQQLQTQLRQTANPRLYLPPGVYKFNTGNAFEAAFSAWIIAVPALTGFMCLELDSIA